MNLLIKTLNNNLYKIVELALLSSILPYVVLVLKFYNLVLPILWLVTLYCIIIFYLKENNINYKLKNIFNINRLVLIKIIIRWIIFSAILLLITYYYLCKIHKNLEGLVVLINLSLKFVALFI